MEIMKIFSSYDDYGYEEDRIYSVLLSEEEMMLFSEGKKNKKLSKLDKRYLRRHKLQTKKEKRNYRILYDKNSTREEREKAMDSLSKPEAVLLGISSGALGGVAGSIPGMTMKNGKAGKIATVAGGIAGAAGGAYGGYKLAKKAGRIQLSEQSKLWRGDPKYLDLMNVSEGRLSKEDYIKKHGISDEDENY